ncbi:DNA adenine methylase [Yoonia rosea]|uniref:DNA adenine methylase n=1 Tax=Yoonia rosea TaxID=287098 RepID=UPI00241817CB|nr:Dam family site-specific DNA-(adenine-N6)-methyltransferase [Yoonia rosea]
MKWAGGKRWLVDREEFKIPSYTGRYIEPFLGGGAVFFFLQPTASILSDINPKLIETYQSIRDDWKTVWSILSEHQIKHCSEYYYRQRGYQPGTPAERAALFLYLNRSCWNGLYRENLKGQFNVPIGTKTKILMDDDDFQWTSQRLEKSEISCCDFADTIKKSEAGDFLFVDPPYTTAHNMNGFVKYNQNIFSWEDQIRLRDELVAARNRGVHIVSTNANHQSVHDLYRNCGELYEVSRASVISGKKKGRSSTEELLIVLEP